MDNSTQDNDIEPIVSTEDLRAMIIKNQDYYKTLKRDNARQAMRRMTHQFRSWYEKMTCLPRWKAKIASNTREKLSVCIITMNSANRIVPLLQYLRSYVDEIVVGVDSKTTDNTFEVCQGLTDVLFTIENGSLTCNAGLEALVERCSGDWVLRLDDDEFPEPLFWKIVRGVISENKYTHYKLPRLHISHLYPENGQLRWINDGYLYPDFQMRLFKNDPELLSYPGAVGHSSIECAGRRGRINVVNLIHLNLAINPRSRREKKLYNYIRRHDGGWVHPINEHALLFEDFNYRIEPYTHPDNDFCKLLGQVIMAQREAYGEPISIENSAVLSAL